MNDLKESHETIKQTTDELKKQQDDLKTIIDTLNKEKTDWVDFHILFYSFFSFDFFSSGEKI
jgi:FtsZ-binding cell division protein ZapB